MAYKYKINDKEITDKVNAVVEIIRQYIKDFVKV